MTKTEILGIKAPKKPCTDQKCPFHGCLNVKKELAQGIVIKKDAHHSATIEWKRPYFVSKYERYEIRRSRLRVHNPPCLNAQVGQNVLAAKTRPLSKNKTFVILQIIKTESKEKKSKKTPSKKEEPITPTQNQSETTKNRTDSTKQK